MGSTLATGSWDDTILLWELTPSPIDETLPADINGDGAVNVLDLIWVASHFGTRGETAADVNGDGIVNILDLQIVAALIAAAPSQIQLKPEMEALPTLWQELSEIPAETALLSNYPNPFNPETWIPYHLAEPADVTLNIYAADGKLVRRLALGYQPAGVYESKSRAAYWDGRNAAGERVASGLYFYTFTAGEFAATGKMLIMK